MKSTDLGPLASKKSVLLARLIDVCALASLEKLVAYDALASVVNL
jgi:hypothetical protein